jgi:hypothetical protein
MSNAVAKKADTAVAVPDYIKQSQRGNENVGTDDVTLPRIDVLQALSPQIKKSDASYIEGAEQGMIFNTLTGELYGDSVIIVPVYFRKRYLLWKDRDSGGGLRGIADTQEEAHQMIAELEESGVEAVETAEHLVLVVDGDSCSEAILSLAKSKMKASRKLNSLARLSGMDRFARRYVLRSIEDESAKGEFWNISVGYDDEIPFPTAEIYAHAESLYDSVVSGTRSVDANYSSPEGEEESDY